MNIKHIQKRALRLGTALPVLAVLGAGAIASPAFAQDSDASVATSDAACDADTGIGCENSDNMIIVTGSILRTNTEEANPVSVIAADDLEKRGVNTLDEAIQNLSANGAGTLPNSFTANGAFSAGASAASLRGLTTSSTLVLFDGLRAAYYPLADDGTRNFVDLNTIPDAIVDRVEVLKDGASSTYGADAVAGVINVITKKQITGLHLQGEYGISQEGDAGTQRFAATYGVGDLGQDGFNVYVSGSYYHSELLKNNQRDGVLGSDDTTGLCNSAGTDCLGTGVYNGREFDGSYGGLQGLFLDQFYSRPYNVVGGAPAAAGGYERLVSGQACQYGATVLSAAELAANPILADNTVCQADLTNIYGVIQPEQQRINATLRATAQLSDDIEAYFQVNYAQSDVNYSFYNTSAIRSSAPAASGITFNVSPLYLPVYICAGATPINNQPFNNGCNAGNGTLNPNNPYAAAGQVARVLGNLPDINEESRYKTDSFRAAFGVSGTFADDWYFDVTGTAMKVELERTLKGRAYIANFLQAVADGSYNFVNPELNTQAVRDFVAPTVVNRSTSEMYQLQANIARDLFDLPGGPLQVGIGASIRHERVNAPGADGDNSSDPTLVDPTQRYTSRINPFGSAGDRTVWSVYGEARAPIVDMVELNLSGRYDSYNTGQSNFSPKAGIKITPIPQIALRGTYSRGFRIGSFAEFGATPTTGYITGQATIPQAIQDQYRAANGGTLPAYITSYSLGLTSGGNPNLAPEKSENLTFGIVVEPMPGISFTVDYYQIKKTDVITGADYTPAVAAYYAGQPIPAGFTITPDTPAVGAQFAGLLPRVQFVGYSFENLLQQKSRGIDFSASARFPLTDSITFSSSLEATYVLELSQTDANGTQRYEGTIGPYVITSASGTPEWRGSWQNTLEVDNFYISATAYYTDSYSTSAEDITGVGSGNDCASSLASTYLNSGTPYQCKVDSFINVNLAAGVTVADRFTVYGNINNLFDVAPPIDTATYGGHLYNPAWANAGVIGRSFRIGVKAEF